MAGVVKLTGLCATVSRDPSALRRKFDFLSGDFAPRSYDADEVDALLLVAERRYAGQDFQSGLTAIETALRLLLSKQPLAPSSRRENDTDRKHLVSLATALRLWDKHAAWLGLSDVAPITTLDIFTDVQAINDALNEPEEAARILSTKAFFLARTGRFRDAYHAVQSGLANVREPRAKRDLLGALASLYTRRRDFQLAKATYERCCELDEHTGTTRASEGLVLANLGFCEARSGLAEHGRVGWRRMRLGLDIVRQANHPGFELQVLGDLFEVAIRGHDTDESESVANDIEGVLSRSPHAYANSRRRFRLLHAFYLDS